MMMTLMFAANRTTTYITSNSTALQITTMEFYELPCVFVCGYRYKHAIIDSMFVVIGRIRLGDFRGALLGHAHMRRSRLCSTKICESNRNCIVFIKDDGSDGD